MPSDTEQLQAKGHDSTSGSGGLHPHPKLDKPKPTRLPVAPAQATVCQNSVMTSAKVNGGFSQEGEDCWACGSISPGKRRTPKPESFNAQKTALFKQSPGSVNFKELSVFESDHNFITTGDADDYATEQVKLSVAMNG